MPIGPTPTQLAEETAKYQSAAAEALAANPTPATPPAPVTEANIGLLSPTSKQPALDASQAAGMREAWMKAGHDPAAFDAAMVKDGIKLTPEPTAEAKARADFGLPVEPKASDYRPQLANARELSPERLAATTVECQQWCSAMGLPSSLGEAIIEHLSQLGPSVAKMAPEAKAAWLANERAHGIRLAGSETNYKAMVERATAALKLAGDDNAISAALAQSTVLNSYWLVATLANFASTMDAYRAAHPAKKP